MNQVQFDRWRDFAIRMARTHYRGARLPSAKWIEEAVIDFIDGIDEDDIPCIHDWDHSDPYPDGSPHRRSTGTYRCACGYRGEGYSDGYTEPKPDCTHCNGSGTAHHWAHPYGVGDMMIEWATGWGDGYVIRNSPDMPKKLQRRIEALYDKGEPDKAEDLEYEEWYERLKDPVHSCVRAALDCASAPSAGVMGLTAGDLRRMYPEGVPDWVKGSEPWESVPITGVVPGIGVTLGEAKPNGTFDELPDDAPIWI